VKAPPPEVAELRALVARLAAVLCPDRLRPWVAELDEAWTLVAGFSPEPAGVSRWAVFVESGQTVAWLCLEDAERPWLAVGADDFESVARVLRVAAENAEACLALAESGAAELDAATRDTEPPEPLDRDCFEPIEAPTGAESTTAKAAKNPEKKAPWDV